MLSVMEAFIKDIRENQGDEVKRAIFADWLDDHDQHDLAEELRLGRIPFMICKGERTRFEQAIIAQDDDHDYQESGWVAVQIGNWCALAQYAHCSCYGTWAAITGGGISDDEGPSDPMWNWEGTYEELMSMALERRDPAMPDRIANPEDYDYDHLMNVYDQLTCGTGT